MAQWLRAGVAVGAVGLLAGLGEAPAAAGQQNDRSQRLYPSLQRPPGDPEVVARGEAVYGISCRACHGMDLRGGDLGGPNLLRSQLVLRDEAGELIGPVIRDGQSGPGGSYMPPQPMSDEDLQAVVTYVHDVLGTGVAPGGAAAG